MRHIVRDGEAISAACFGIALLFWFVGENRMAIWIGSVGALSLVAMLCLEDTR